MTLRLPIRCGSQAQAETAIARRCSLSGVAGWWLAAAIPVCMMLAAADPGFAQAKAPVQLDSVVAVVNRQVILSSDLDNDIQLSILDPPTGSGETMSRKHALEELISRALIQQQIRQDDLPAIEPSAADVTARVEEIRKDLPACVRAHCSTDAGWKAFLAAHNLTQYRVQTYLRTRMEILRFIEERFRQGIQITDQQIETYYRDTMLPQYPPGVSAPPLNQVKTRIQEILLEEQVNQLFDAWLDNLRTQGDVEILDPSLQEAQSAASQEGGTE